MDKEKGLENKHEALVVVVNNESGFEFGYGSGSVNSVNLTTSFWGF